MTGWIAMAELLVQLHVPSHQCLFCSHVCLRWAHHLTSGWKTKKRLKNGGLRRANGINGKTYLKKHKPLDLYELLVYKSKKCLFQPTVKILQEFYYILKRNVTQIKSAQPLSWRMYTDLMPHGTGHSTAQIRPPIPRSSTELLRLRGHHRSKDYNLATLADLSRSSDGRFNHHLSWYPKDPEPLQGLASFWGPIHTPLLYRSFHPSIGLPLGILRVETNQIELPTHPQRIFLSVTSCS